MSRHARWTAVMSAVPLAAMALTGCAASSGAATTSSSGTPTATASPKPAGVHILDAENSFSLTVPTGWVVAQDPQRATPLVVTGATSTPDPSASTAARAGFDAGAKTVALGPVASSFRPNANVVIQPAQGASPSDIAKVTASAEKGLTALGAEDVTMKATTVDGQPAELVDYHLTLSGSTTQITGRQVYVINGSSAYVLTVSLGPDADTHVADTVISSLEVGKGAA